jgi:hypothetical protein
LCASIPAIVNTAIAMLNSTSLVLIIGLFDLLNAAKAAIVDPVCQAFSLEIGVTSEAGERAVSTAQKTICETELALDSSRRSGKTRRAPGSGGDAPVACNRP